MGSLVLPPAAIVYLDANVLIYGVERKAPYDALLQGAWRTFDAGSARAIGSELLIVELLVGPLKQGNRTLFSAYEAVLWSGPLRLNTISATVLRNAADIRVASGLKTPDAIHAATAIDAGCTVFLTNDIAFRRVAGLPVWILDEILAAP